MLGLDPHSHVFASLAIGAVSLVVVSFLQHVPALVLRYLATEKTAGRVPMNSTSLDTITSAFMEGYDAEEIFFKEHKHIFPRRDVVYQLIDEIRSLIFPGYFDDESQAGVSSPTLVSERLLRIERVLCEQVRRALLYDDVRLSNKAAYTQAAQITAEFLAELPRLQHLLLKDAEAAFEGDPAAHSREEVILCYPGMRAIMVHRIAHELYLRKVPLIPRLMSERAHGQTGIDIHPGATIGEYFFIDHGTGVVIGETTEIGNYVKLYQGVTLGALSTRKGQELSGVKRHPTIGDRVTIYSNSTVLGGETVIGENTIVGGNTFITESISADTKVSAKNPELVIKAPRSKEEEMNLWYWEI